MDHANPTHNGENTDPSSAAQEKTLFRFITCGSVDDGKSTLIGRLLFETGALFEDQLSALARDSLRHGTQGKAIDYALLLDGLEAEREQGITIDVAYRFFSTERRKFIVADCPGHVQYTRNMATGASTADAAIVLVDARKGVSAQTLRHSQILSLLGVPQVILAINKLDACDYSQARFDALVSEYRAATEALGFAAVHAIPMSALNGDNLLRNSANTPWYQGRALLPLLETLSERARYVGQTLAFRMPVQWVCRPNQDFRGFAGMISQGQISVGQQVVAVGSSVRQARVHQLLRGERSVQHARAGDSVIVVLDHELDISRGDVLSAADAQVQRAQAFTAKVLWISDRPAQIGQRYWLKVGNSSELAEITAIHQRIAFADQADDANDTQPLSMNQLASVSVRTLAPLALESYRANRQLGAFILIDRVDHSVAAAGAIDTLEASNENVDATRLTQQTTSTQQTSITAQAFWLTGISGAGKTTLARAFSAELKARGHAVAVLDGDELRQGLSADLGLSREDRAEHLRRTAEVARLLVDAGVIAVVSLISPYARDRAHARTIIGSQRFVEVYIDTPLATAQARDPKGLYARAAQGTISEMTGVSAPYEAPLQPDLRLHTATHSVSELVQRLLSTVAKRTQP
jgi:bifunctional enzyme CysN/CysC